MVYAILSKKSAKLESIFLAFALADLEHGQQEKV